MGPGWWGVVSKTVPDEITVKVDRELGFVWGAYRLRPRRQRKNLSRQEVLAIAREEFDRLEVAWDAKNESARPRWGVYEFASEGLHMRMLESDGLIPMVWADWPEEYLARRRELMRLRSDQATGDSDLQRTMVRAGQDTSVRPEIQDLDQEERSETTADGPIREPAAREDNATNPSAARSKRDGGDLPTAD
jgi:hypothetical protein